MSKIHFGTGGWRAIIGDDFTKANVQRMSYALAEINRHAPVELNMDAWRVGNIAQALPRVRELGMNVAAKRIAETAKKICPACDPEAAIDAGGEEDAKIETARVATIDDLRAFCASNARAAWAAVQIDAAFSIATPAGGAVLPLGGDLLSAGVSAEEALAAAEDLLDRADCVELWNVKTFPSDRAYLDRAFDVMLAAYALNPQRPSFDADELCAQFGVQDYNVCPAYAVHRLAERQRAQLRENDLTRVYSEIEFPLAHVLRDMEREGFLVDADALREMGADISGKDGNLCPLTIHPAPLHGIHYTMPVASAQLKSAILLAGLFADSPTTVVEPAPSRDHTERMLRGLGRLFPTERKLR